MFVTPGAPRPSNNYIPETKTMTSSQHGCFGDICVLFDLSFNVFVHLGRDSLLLKSLFLAIASQWDFSMCLRRQCVPSGWKTDHLILLNYKRLLQKCLTLNLIRLSHPNV